MTSKYLLSCPFCPFEDTDPEFLIQHVDEMHPETTESPATTKCSMRQERRRSDQGMEGANGTPPLDYVECRCGEFCLLTEFDSHLEMHNAAGESFDEIGNTAADLSSPPLLHSGFSSSSSMDKPPSSAFQDIATYADNYIPTTSLIQHNTSSTIMRDTHGQFSPPSNAMRFSAAPSGRTSRDLRGRHPPGRLGKAELGPFAYERRMPHWLRELLESGPKIIVSNQIGSDGRLIHVKSIANEIEGIVPVIARLCVQDDDTERAYICHPDVTHVVKMSKEGGFCGYRNIQMMVSYIIDTKSEGCEAFGGKKPGIFQLQDMIEQAWDMDFNERGRDETGGIRGTRKYIGTPEAQALLQSLGIRCQADAFNECGEGAIYHDLLAAVEHYFLDGLPNLSHKVCRTSLPPIYFQHPGHSLTIVGFERRKCGTCRLLVLDPMFKPSPDIYKLIGATLQAKNPGKLLKAYRRDYRYLAKYKSFEILKLEARVPPKVYWDGR